MYREKGVEDESRGGEKKKVNSFRKGNGITDTREPSSRRVPFFEIRRLRDLTAVAETSTTFRRAFSCVSLEDG